MLYNCIMLSIKKLGMLANRYMVGIKDSLKERDEAAEKVYINKQEAGLLKKLAERAEQEQLQRMNEFTEFDAKLKQILTRHSVEDEVFFTEISNLHKMVGRNQLK